jgi:23S rRNA (cytosine1962-C5)-methyltransferase
MSEVKIFSEGWEDYELMDAGGGKKLERWGKVITIRPEHQAYFKSEWTFEKWAQLAHWEFVQKASKSGSWKALKQNSPKEWQIGYNKLKFNLELTKFKHLGIFPEQRVNWEYISRNVKNESRFLNLFAYTGASSLVARNLGAETYHVDSVKQLINWASANQEASRLLNIKWVLEDALKFAKREEKRGNTYDGIIMDPPAWGVGAKGEQWKLEDKIDELLGTAASLLSETGFLVVNTYSLQVDYKMMLSLSKLYFSEKKVTVRELWMKTTTGKELYFGVLLRVENTSSR